MKSYCDVDQCKVLMEFLPHETADLWYAERYKGHVKPNGVYVAAVEPYYYPSLKKPSERNWSQDIIKDIPCWSLVALLSVIKPVNSNTYTLTGTLDGGATIEFDGVTNVMYQEEEIIDAVYKMIVKLHEQKLL